MAKITVCDTKVIYDSEFEAQVALAKMEWRTGKEFMYYQCNRHYHLSHKHKEERMGHGKGFTKCIKCGDLMKQKQKKRHTC